ncbi:MAG: glycosyltransferase [Thermoplasmataceae archaeon]
MSELVILGAGKLNSSLNSYAKEFSEASARRRIVILNSKDQIKYLNSYETRTEKGLLRTVPGNGWSLNNVFGKVIFRKLASELRDVPIHYTTFGLPVLRKRENDLVTIHDLLFLDEEDEAYRRTFNISRFLLDRFISYENIIAPSWHVKTQLSEYGFTGRIDVVYQPVPAEFYPIHNKAEIRKELNLPLDKILILSVSSALRRKNLPTIQETLKGLGDKFRLVRVGPGIGDSITFTDVSTKKLNLIYNACDVFLFPTFAEGFGRPVIEAFSAGLPTVVSDIGVMHEVSGDASIFVEPTAEGCVQGIERALDLSDTLREKGFNQAEKFSRELFTKRVNDIYARVENQN